MVPAPAPEARAVSEVPRFRARISQSDNAPPLSIGGAIALFDTIKEKVIEDERSVAQLNAILRATAARPDDHAKRLVWNDQKLTSCTIFATDGAPLLVTMNSM